MQRLACQIAVHSHLKGIVMLPVTLGLVQLLQKYMYIGRKIINQRVWL